MEEEYGEDGGVVWTTRMIVSPNQFAKAYHLTFGTTPSVKIAPIVGMAGIGKTTLAREIFHHPNIENFFECRVWVEVGRFGVAEEITRRILVQIDPAGKTEELDGERIRSTVREILKVKRYLIVLDDVWDSQLWMELSSLFDNKRDHSGVVLTTRLQDVALMANPTFFQMSLLNNQQSWDLLCEKVFGDAVSYPLELEKPGRKIAEECDGLPLTITTVAAILSDGADFSVKLWNEIASSRSHSVFMKAYKRIYDVLYKSYADLSSSHLKHCFLYMGVFPQRYEIPTSKLIKLWGVENFLDTNVSKPSSEVVVEYLERLHAKSLALTVQDSSKGGTKSCRLHSVFWYLCNIEASKSKFYAVLNNKNDCFEEGVETQSRFSIKNNVLFSIREVREIIEDIPDVVSLLCFGPYHVYQVPICLHSSVLTVLDALSIRFYEFPNQVENLEQLKYLALTTHGDIPSSISKLSMLEFLIIQRHLAIVSPSNSTFLPAKVWEMKRLKHLQVAGCNLRHPKEDDELPNLVALLDVGVECCTRGVLERTPNLEKLGIRIALAPEDDDEAPPPSSIFDYHVSHLQYLRSLKCVIVNPTLAPPEDVVVPPRLPDLPLGLKKLSLSGFGYPWEEMRKIASLPNLEVLKLRCSAFRGRSWEARSWEFCALKHLLIEDTDLVEWRAASTSFYRIQRIILKNCYGLQDIPLKFWNNVYGDLADCNPSAAMYKLQHYIPTRHRKIHAKYSW